jgi:ribosomal protein L11 methyltransferase
MVRIETIPDQDWNETWKASFTPIDVDDDTVILPPWLAKAYGGAKKPLIIDPGMAFGTGHHPTTRECIRAVTLCARLAPGRGAMLDVGTGTGVLAIQGALLGFCPVVGLDIDPAAIDAARRNAEWNGVSDRISMRRGGIETVLSGPYALITANLLLNILVAYAPRFKTLAAPGGFLVLSGILASQEDTLAEALHGSGLTVRERHPSEEWVTLIVSA